MRGSLPLFFVFFLFGLLPLRQASAADKPFEFNDGDRVAFVGNDFFEREADQAYIETQLATRFPGKNLVFRNLGYAGDTVSGDARSLCAGWDNFGPADQGFNRLKQLVAHLNPTVIFVAYGMNESFKGDAGLADFCRGLSWMLDMLTKGKPRVVLISPIYHEDLGAPFPNPAAHNQQLAKYVTAESDEAARRGYGFINLFEMLTPGRTSAPIVRLTRDGIHLTPLGYWHVAAAIEAGLGYPPRVWQVVINSQQTVAVADGTKVSHLESAGVVSFQTEDELLPMPAPPDGSSDTRRKLKISGLKPGTYVLRSGDTMIASASAAQWAAGVEIALGPPFSQVESLRQLIRSKNVDFFNYWRPENDTYILGYRNGEQGRNAKEIPLFEPMAQAKDAQIAKLCLPQTVSYTLAAK